MLNARTAAIVAILACCAGVAFAQGATPDGRFFPQYDHRPSGNDFIRNYPRAALETSTQGVTHLCCTPREDRTLDCRVGLEYPEGQGFGQAAIEVSKQYRLSERSYAAFRADPNAWMQVAVPFRLETAPEGSPDIDAIARDINQRAQGLCKPGAPQ